MVHDTPPPLIWPRRRDDGTGPPRVPGQLRRQVAQAARFGAFARLCDDPQALFDEACRAGAEGLASGFAKLLVYRAGERRFVLQAGVGWRGGLIGQARLDADTGTAAGLAWHSGQPVVSNDIVAEGRFRVPAPPDAHGIGCGINVVVPGEPGGPAFGVLEVEGRGRGDFGPEDVGFLQLLAHSLAAAVGRIAGQAAREAQSAREARGALDHETAMGEMHHRVRNDLHAVCASVWQEARAAADAGQRAGYGRIGGRVLALAGLYDHLLGVGDAREEAAASLEFGGYLRELCLRIAAAGGLEARVIALQVEAEPVAMSRRRALPLAVAVNELVSNAVEHAFAGGASGWISVSLRTADGGVVLGVADSGRGFAGPPPAGSGLGFVERLVRQAGGVLERGDGGGTAWRIVLGTEG